MRACARAKRIAYDDYGCFDREPHRSRLLNHPLLLVLLADGGCTRANGWRKELRVSRAAVWKGMERLRAWGWRCRRCRGAATACRVRWNCWMRGASAPNLDRSAGRSSASSSCCSKWIRPIRGCLAAAPPPPGSADACLSELQHAGRGRRGRRWIAPFGAGIALSLAWTFGDGAGALPALSLGVGVAVSRALARAGARGVALKWPNDIWFNDRKIGGVLIELRAEAGGPAHVVIGVGINVALHGGGAPRNRSAVECASRRWRTPAPSHRRAIWWPGPSWTNF